jgi:hypothetical protein
LELSVARRAVRGIASGSPADRFGRRIPIPWFIPL